MNAEMNVADVGALGVRDRRRRPNGLWNQAATIGGRRDDHRQPAAR